MRTVYPCRLNKRFSSEFPVRYPVQYTLDEGRRAQWPKHCDNNKQILIPEIQTENQFPISKSLPEASFKPKVTHFLYS